LHISAAQQHEERRENLTSRMSCLAPAPLIAGSLRNREVFAVQLGRSQAAETLLLE
jgi:hypothetical protein